MDMRSGVRRDEATGGVDEGHRNGVDAQGSNCGTVETVARDSISGGRDACHETVPFEVSAEGTEALKNSKCGGFREARELTRINEWVAWMAQMDG